MPAAVQHKAGLSLKGNILTLTASDLGGVNGPVAIDPSVLVTSVNDFQTNGNNDGDITSVSYTHLDVYKRQQLGLVLSQNEVTKQRLI